MNPTANIVDLTTAPEFHSFPKIHRLFRPVVITEKIDGSNAAVGITEDGTVYAQSRKRLITPDQDNFGFARWVAEHKDELRDGLGPGLHFGEWAGLGIQRGYGLPDKRFFLFNVARWTDDVRPACCHVVPTIVNLDVFDTMAIQAALEQLRENGSYVAPFMNPEGIVVYHRHANTAFKITLKGDDTGKEQGA